MLWSSCKAIPRPSLQGFHPNIYPHLPFQENSNPIPYYCSTLHIFCGAVMQSNPLYLEAIRILILNIVYRPILISLECKNLIQGPPCYSHWVYSESITYLFTILSKQSHLGNVHSASRVVQHSQFNTNITCWILANPDALFLYQ